MEIRVLLTLQMKINLPGSRVGLIFRCLGKIDIVSINGVWLDIRSRNSLFQRQFCQNIIEYE